LLNPARLCSSIRGCTALLIAVLLPALAGCGSSAAGDIVQATYNSVGARDCQPGITYYAGFAGFSTSGTQPEQVRSVQVLGVPKGMKVIGVYAVPLDNKFSRVGLLMRYDIVTYRKGQHFYPASQAVLQPTGEPEQWYFVVALRSTIIGTVETTGLRVTDDSGSVDFPDKVKIATVTTPPQPQDCPPDPS
jgi:hypothetical protein